MGLVLDFMKIHPMATLLGGEGLGLTSSVRMSDEMSIAMHGYFTNEDTLDIDAYNQKWKEALTKVS